MVMVVGGGVDVSVYQGSHDVTVLAVVGGGVWCPWQGDSSLCRHLLKSVVPHLPSTALYFTAAAVFGGKGMPI